MNRWRRWGLFPPTHRASRKVEALVRDFEQQRVCYLPFNIFLLRPLHRLLHYKLILERLCKHYPPTHDDFRDCRGRNFFSYFNYLVVVVAKKCFYCTFIESSIACVFFHSFNVLFETIQYQLLREL